MSARARLVDRHVFASNASAYDAAWSTVASTPALEGVRAGRIEERIPWGAGLERERDAPVLAAESGAVSPLAQLPLAYLPMDGRTGLSVTGLIRGRGGRVRVGTHTLLLDKEVFEAIDGFPLGLFAPGASGVEPAEWFPEFRRTPVGAEAGLEPLRIPTRASRAAFGAARLSAVSSLAGWVGGRMGEAEARGLLAAVFDGLAGAADTGALVVLEPGPTYAGDRGSWIRNVVLLAWLSLPLADRYAAYFSSDGTGAAFAKPLLSGAVEQGSRAPGGRPALYVSPGGPAAAPRFVEWARCVMAGPTVFGPVSRRADLRGQSLLSERTPVVVPRPFPATPAALRTLVEKELRGPARRGGLGVTVAQYLKGSSPEDRTEALHGLSRVEGLLESRRFVDGVVRGLIGDDGAILRSTEGARFAVAVGARSSRRGSGLDLAVRGLTTLLEKDAGYEELASLVQSASKSDGPEAGAELWRLGLGLLRRFGRCERLPSHVALLASLPGSATTPGVAGDLTELMGEGWGDVAATAGIRPPDGGWHAALTALWRTLAEDGADPGRTDLQRLAWQERRRFGCTALASLPSSTATRRFLRGFMDGDPALPVFLDLRGSPLWLEEEGVT